MRVLVCGGRAYDDYMAVESVLKQITNYGDIIVHGAADGADNLASRFADYYGIKQESHPADWSTHGKAAGPIRNQKMLDSGIDLVIAFPGGRGTADMMSRAYRAGVPVLAVYRP